MRDLLPCTWLANHRRVIEEGRAAVGGIGYEGQDRGCAAAGRTSGLSTTTLVISSDKPAPDSRMRRSPKLACELMIWGSSVAQSLISARLRRPRRRIPGAGPAQSTFTILRSYACTKPISTTEGGVVIPETGLLGWDRW